MSDRVELERQLSGWLRLSLNARNATERRYFDTEARKVKRKIADIAPNA